MIAQGIYLQRFFFDEARSYAYERLKKSSLRINEPARAQQFL